METTMKKGNSCRNLVLLDQIALSDDRLVQLKRLFKMMASDTRLRMLHALIRSGELCVNDLAKVLGMKPQAISNQLQRMGDQGILGPRREGNNIYYRITDPCVPEIMDRAFCLIDMAHKTARSRGISVRPKR